MKQVTCLWVVCCIGFLASVSAQEVNRNPTEFIQGIQSNHEVRFYYDTAWFASLGQYPVPDEQSLVPLVTAYFSQIEVDVIFRGSQVFLSNQPIRKVFPSGFYQIEQSVTATEPEVELVTRNYKEEVINPEFETRQFGSPSSSSRSSYIIQGTISSNDAPSEGLVGATVQIKGTTQGIATDTNGKYSIEVPRGQHELLFKAVGMQPTSRKIKVYNQGELNVEMRIEVTQLGEVIVTGRQNDKVNNMAVGVERLEVQQLDKMPMVLGEKDIVRAVLTFPGVQTVTEVSNGFNVRGGSTDQNLVLIDAAPVLNSSHFFGFFSAFNSDIIEEATLYKGGIPSRLGGKLSSVLDIKSKRGSKEQFKGSLGISPITGRVHLEGPLIANKLSFVAGGRSTYSDWILNRVKDPRITNSKANFYDLFGKLSYNINNKSVIDFSSYYSSDYFLFDGISTYEYTNQTNSLSYFTTLGRDLSYEASIFTSRYDFSVIEQTNPTIATKSSFLIDQYGMRNSFDFQRGWLNLNFGLEGTFYQTLPGQVVPFGQESIIDPIDIELERGLEASAFIQNEHEVTGNLTLSYGVRYSAYGNTGRQTIYNYASGSPKSESSIQDTTFTKGGINTFYSGLEPRFLLKLKTGKLSSIKGSYNRMRQYLNLLSNNVTPAPTDIWKLSGTHFLPQIADQFSLGYFKDFNSIHGKVFTLSLEGYYKTVQNLLDYKVGADLIGNETIETEVVYGSNRSYGLEVQLQKRLGDLSGWINYTYSRSLNTFDSRFIEEQINNGASFPANFDKPHAFNSVLNYDFFRRLRTSLNLKYSTGRPVTLPVTSFQFGDRKRIQYETRNQARLPDYFRLDLSATWEGNIKKDKIFHDSYTLSVVNLTGRNNPYSVFFQYDENDRLRAYSLSIFADPIITVTLNLEF